MFEDKKIKPRVRLIIIKNNKILLSYVKSESYYFYIGGKVEWGERIDSACKREVYEEAMEANFTFKKILYIRDYIKPAEDEHSLELYILGEIDKYEEIEGHIDSEFGGDHYQTWVDLSKLEEINIKPAGLTKQLLTDFKNGFAGDTRYLGEIE